MVDLHEATTWIGAGKSALQLLQAAKQLLPNGKAKDEICVKIAEAESALKRSDAKLAHELGYGQCHCSFPPSYMLWRERERRFVCSNPECGKMSAREDDD